MMRVQDQLNCSSIQRLSGKLSRRSNLPIPAFQARLLNIAYRQECGKTENKKNPADRRAVVAVVAWVGQGIVVRMEGLSAADSLHLVFD